MPIFGAKSRAARGCASKPACGRRIDPRGARPFLRNIAANLPLPRRADRVVRPYRTLCEVAENAYNFAIASCRGERGIDPLALPLGELSPKATERVFLIYPLRPRCARTPPPKGEARVCAEPAGLLKSKASLDDQGEALVRRKASALHAPFGQGQALHCAEDLRFEVGVLCL